MNGRYNRKNGVQSYALFSDDEVYRYALGRCWNPDPKGKVITFIMLNPSTATELKNDPTVERCERRAKELGMAGFWVVNLFALRSTDPKLLYTAKDPVGPLNDSAISIATSTSQMILCAWGVHGEHMGRGAVVRSMLEARGIKCHHLGLTKEGHPRHPLYISYKVQPTVWS